MLCSGDDDEGEDFPSFSVKIHAKCLVTFKSKSTPIPQSTIRRCLHLCRFKFKSTVGAEGYIAVTGNLQGLKRGKFFICHATVSFHRLLLCLRHLLWCFLQQQENIPLFGSTQHLDNFLKSPGSWCFCNIQSNPLFSKCLQIGFELKHTNTHTLLLYVYADLNKSASH